MANGEDKFMLRESKKDAKALCLIQQEVDGPILDQIVDA